MSVVVGGEQPEIAAWLARRRTLGQDGFDEVWEGVYHVSPNARSEHAQVAAEIVAVLRDRAWAAGLVGAGPFNLGVDREDFRVPDGGWFAASSPGALYVPTAAAVLEVLSPDDETFAKFDFYAARGVQEILIAHPTARWARCWARQGTQFHETDDSAVLGITMADLTAAVRWP
jgi:Uma2 family endonuclease